MIQRFRPPHWLACAALAAAAVVPSASAYAGPFHSPPRHVAAPASPDDPYEELAGSLAGVGREHPGRPAGEPADPELVVAASRPLPARPRTEPAPRPTPRPTTVVAAPSPPPTVVRALGTGPNDRAADLAAHILPLGTGFALMGLGLGYLGLRLRRGM
ncbi:MULTISPECIES: hypothetical protein [Streptomyces]|uniref:hypothetical protein n=1 Tax=Streptomyces TaxID=1883 RepID=UPI00207A7601|nr:MULTISPECIES: hypothetical protein [Streptomyces]MCM9080704.1 hypothetical protein [Streptomyces spororaveus]MCX5304867.1 hypothetical protein [Streptomyces sp. NBC_00160]